MFNHPSLYGVKECSRAIREIKFTEYVVRTQDPVTYKQTNHYTVAQSREAAASSIKELFEVDVLCVLPV